MQELLIEQTGATRRARKNNNKHEEKKRKNTKKIFCCCCHKIRINMSKTPTAPHQILVCTRYEEQIINRSPKMRRNLYRRFGDDSHALSLKRHGGMPGVCCWVLLYAAVCGPTLWHHFVPGTGSGQSHQLPSERARERERDTERER